eukprot:647664_1
MPEEINVPPQLPDMLKSLAKEIIRNAPNDVVEFCYQYFSAMKDGEIDRFLKIQAEKVTHSGIKCSTFAASQMEDRHLSTGDFQGFLRIWDLERLDTSIFSVCAHDKSINTLDGCGGLGIGNGSPEIATGGAEGCVKLWDPRQIKPVITLQSKDDRISRDCWSVCFGNSFNSTNRCLAAGYDNGDVKLVDLRTTKILWSTNVSNGVVNIEFDRKDIEMNKLLITSLESQFRVYNLKMLKSGAECPHVLQKAHDATVWLGKHLPQNRDLFATLGGNGTIKIWKFFYSKKLRGDDFNYKQNNEFGILELVAENTLTDQPIVSFDWNKEKSGLALVCALDQTCRIIYLSSKE